MVCSFVLCIAFISFTNALTLGRHDINDYIKFPLSQDEQRVILKKSNAANIDYLGSGYDMFSKLGVDEKSSFNLNNYKAPIMDSYAIDMDASNQVDKFGFWIRNEFMCDISIEETKIDNEYTLIKTLSSSVSDGYSNAWSSNNVTEYVKDDLLDTLKRYRNVLVKKYQCTVYSAGLLNDEKRQNMKLFTSIIDNLLNTCNYEFSKGSCFTNVYKSNPYDPKCSKCVTKWMQFFLDYGTHITNYVTMAQTGGIIREFLNNNDAKTRGKSYKNKRIVNESGTFFNLVKSKSENEEEDTSEHDLKSKAEDALTYTIGPEPTSNILSSSVISEWVSAVSKNPAPIRTEFISIEELISDPRGKVVFKEALKYYSELKGNGTENYIRNNFDNVINKLIKESELVISNQLENDSKICKDEKKIVWGFGLTINESRDIIQAKLCYSGLNRCLLESSKDVKSTVILAFCHNTNQYDFTQKMVKGRKRKSNSWTRAKCDNNMVIAFGLIFNINDSNGKFYIRKCIQGKNDCGITDLGHNGIIWIICVPETTTGLQFLKTRIGDKRENRLNECEGKSYKLYHGIKLKQDGSRVIIESCPEHLKSCSMTTPFSDTELSWIMCLI